MGKIKLNNIKTEYYKDMMRIEIPHNNIVRNKQCAKDYLKGKISGDAAKRRYLMSCVGHILSIISSYMQIERHLDKEIGEEESLKRIYDRTIFVRNSEKCDLEYPLMKIGEYTGLTYNRGDRTPLHTISGFAIKADLTALYMDICMVGLINETSGLGPEITNPVTAYEEIKPYLMDESLNDELKAIYDEYEITGIVYVPSFSKVLREMRNSIEELKIVLYEAFYVSRTYGTNFYTCEAFKTLPIADRDGLISVPLKDGELIRDKWSNKLHCTIEKIELAEDYIKRVYNIDYNNLPKEEQVDNKEYFHEPYRSCIKEYELEAYEKFPLSEFEKVRIEKERLDVGAAFAIYNYVHEKCGYEDNNLCRIFSWYKPEALEKNFVIPDQYLPKTEYEYFREKYSDTFYRQGTISRLKDAGIKIDEKETEQFVPVAANIRHVKIPEFLLRKE